MRRAITAFVVTVVVLAGGAIAQQKRQRDIDLQAAIRTEMVDGDLNAAIKQYSAIASKYKADRVVTATALIHMAECYQKMGDAQASQIYQRVLREYADQSAATTIARARLGEPAPVTRARGDRAVWSGPEVDLFGTISPDGRFLTYVDWNATGRLMLRDLVAGTARPLTKPSWLEPGPSGGANFSVISKDGKQVAYEWSDTGVSGDEIRIADLRGTDFPEFRRLPRHEDVDYLAPYDWSADGKWLAVFARRKDRTGQIALMSVQDGTLRVLKSVDWKGPTKIFFSPDGKYIAYDLSVSETRDHRDVFVMAIDGSRETAAVAHPSHNTIMGWSPDGKHLLFASDRSGSIGLWAVPVADGKSQGMPSLVKADIGSDFSLGLTASGTMYVFKDTSAMYVQVAPIDLAAGKLRPASNETIPRFVASRGRPDWSADGKYLAYVSCAPTGGGPCTLYIQARETGDVRELHVPLSYFQQIRWSPDGRSLITSGADRQGRRGIHRVDARSGDTSTVVMASDARNPWYAEWAPDGKSIYYRDRQDSALVIVERELASGNEREVIRTPAAGNFPFSISPDGRYIASASNDGSAKVVLLIPFAGGEARQLIRVSRPEVLTGQAAQVWTPDSRALIVSISHNNDVKDLWRVPISGDQPRKLDIDAHSWVLGEGFRLRPDGREIAFVGQAGKSGYEVWALENFLPAVSAKK